MVSAIPPQAKQKNITVLMIFDERHVPNDDDAILSGDGDAERGIEEWNRDTRAGDENTSWHVSITATVMNMMMMNLIHQEKNIKNQTTAIVNTE